MSKTLTKLMTEPISNYLQVLFHFLLLIFLTSCVSKGKELFVSSCRNDLDAIINILNTHSAIGKNSGDKVIQDWLYTGYLKSLHQCKKVKNTQDVFLVLNFFIKGFNDPHVGLQRTTSISQNTNELERKFAINYLTQGVWIQIPSFAPKNVKETDELKTILQSLKHFRNKEFIVFDFSGNRGGSSAWQKPLLRNLWGDNYLRSLGNKHIYNQKWQKNIRVSYDNFKHLNMLSIFESIKKDQKLPDFYMMEFNCYDDQKNLYSNQDKVPITAKVFILTDSYCASSCWLGVREMLQIPNVMHIGEETQIQTIYSEVRRFALPGRNFNFIFPLHYFISPLDNMGKTFKPKIYYNGDFTDKIKLQRWFFEKVLRL